MNPLQNNRNDDCLELLTRVIYDKTVKIKNIFTSRPNYIFSVIFNDCSSTSHLSDEQKINHEITYIKVPLELAEKAIEILNQQDRLKYLV